MEIEAKGVFWNKKKLELLSSYILIASALVCFYIGDSLTKILYLYEVDAYRVGAFVKTAFELLFILYLIIFFNKTRGVILSIIVLLFAFFTVGQMVLKLQYSDANWFVNFLQFNKFIFIFLFYSVAISFRNTSYFTKIARIYEKILFINSLFIFLGFFFKINTFRSYPLSEWRFGYDGFIFAQNEASYFYILAILYAYYIHFFLKGGKGFLLLWVFASSFLIGTKAIYLFIILLFIFHVIYFKKYKLLLATTLIPIIVVSIPFLLEKLLLRLQGFWSIFLRSYHEEGALTALLSGRDNILKESFFLLINNYWTPLNYLIGGHDISNFLIEMDFFDLFLFFGVLGMGIYLFLLFKTVFSLNYKNYFHLFFTIVLLGIAFTAGHLLWSAVNASYLVIVTFQLKKNNL